MLLALFFACTEPRAPVTVPIFAGGVGEDTWVAADDTVVTLTEATALFGYPQLYAPATAADVAARWSPLRAAHAHPGHDPSGDLTAELVGVWSVDLLAAPVSLGAAVGWEGSLQTAGFHLLSESEEETVVVQLSGYRTTAGGEETPFELQLVEDFRVYGLPLEGALVADRSTPITYRGDPVFMLSFADWATEDDGDGVLRMDDGNLANTITFGVTNGGAWSASW